MISSFYNFYVSTDKVFVVYNACSGALVSFDLEDSDRIRDLISNPGVMSRDSFLYKQLFNNGFIVSSKQSEIERIQKRRYDQFRTESSGVSYVIAPTTGCNFNCSYCYQNMITSGDKSTMNREVIDGLKEFIKQTSEKKDSIHITWYGGEPLLCMDVIDEISEFAKCIKGSSKYTSSILTNGFLISDDVISFLKRNSISGIQITIDGDEQLHNSRRFTKTHGPTYDRIMNNCIRLIQEGFSVALRVNIDRLNPKAHLDVMNAFKNKGVLNVDVSPAITRYSDKNRIISVEEYAKIRMEHHRTVKEMGFLGTEQFLIPNPTSCDFFNPQSYNIDPEGNLWRCLEDIGDKSVTVRNKATIFNKESYVNRAITEYRDWLEIPTECIECKYLPLCTIGCPREEVYKSEFSFSESCTIYKYCIEDYLLLLLEDMPVFQTKPTGQTAYIV